MMPHAREWVTNHFAPILADEGFMDGSGANAAAG
jgi:hypothetical protein